jgi:hypothetical protein
MEELACLFMRSASVVGVSDRGQCFRLALERGPERVVALEPIPVGAVIGRLDGRPCYIWEVAHSEYLFVDDDLILDVSHAVPRQILSFLRDDNQSEHIANCEIGVKYGTDGGPDGFLLVATRPIAAGEELVYVIS